LSKYVRTDRAWRVTADQIAVLRQSSTRTARLRLTREQRAEADAIHAQIINNLRMSLCVLFTSLWETSVNDNIRQP